MRLRLVPADKSSPFQMVQALSSHLQEVPAEDVLLSLHHVPQVCTLSPVEMTMVMVLWRVA